VNVASSPLQWTPPGKFSKLSSNLLLGPALLLCIMLAAGQEARRKSQQCRLLQLQWVTCQDGCQLAAAQWLALQCSLLS
jgi:hypothetical protein